MTDTIDLLLDAVQEVYGEKAPNESLRPPFIEHVEEARATERAKVLSEVEELKQIPDEIPEPVLEPHDEYNWDWRICKICGEKNIGDRAYLEHMRRKHGLSKKTTSKYYNQAIDDVLAKLNQLKEEGDLK